MEISVGTSTIYIRRLLTREGQPVFYHRGYLIYDPIRPIVEAEMDVTSFQGLFAHADNSLLKRGQLNIEATLMNPEEAELLGSPFLAAAFFLEHLFYDFDDRPISWGWFLPQVIRLFGLLTLAFDSVKEIIDLICTAGDDDIATTPIIIGGNQLNEMICAYTGADYWVTDAMEGVRICQKNSLGENNRCETLNQV